MNSAARDIQFEMKVTYFQFVINVSWQRNNVKMILNLKIKLQRFQSYFFCEIDDDTPGFF